MQAINEAMNMSLDDYIALNKLKIKNNNNGEADNTNKNAFKARSRHENDERQSDDDNEDSCSDTIMKNPLDEIQKNDFNTVYNESLEENSAQNLPPANSQQWRIDPVNVNRPAGMAPLIPRNVPKTQRSVNNNNRQQFKNKNYNSRGRNHYYQPNRNNNNFNRQQNRNFAAAYRNIGNVSRGQVQLNAVSKLYQNFRNNDDTIIRNNNGSIDRMAIHNNFKPGMNYLALNADNSHDYQPKLSHDSLIRPNQMEGNLGKLSLASIFNVDNNIVAQGNLGSMAGKFIDFLTNYENTVHKPVYDMDIQQEIAKLQNKKMVCTNSGTIVSTDGTGVPDCKIVPKTTAMSLNIRYC